MLRRCLLSLSFAAVGLGRVDAPASGEPGTTTTRRQFQAGEIGSRLPDFLREGLEGRELPRLSFFRGKVVLIDFWATWCQLLQAGDAGIIEARQPLRISRFRRDRI